ncbi:hypothetical protein Dsin_002166 [Dipteronia sinensis]|uniref:PPIase cyclophilin-type domain-containing protein n=1 Tax=Dipteronia sinensis TaxID=43782 RepID=A0AAE0B6P9_9ROSI|nr:hypothetical protein Dsin_002166 [Dipteronia sinensis]
MDNQRAEDRKNVITRAQKKKVDTPPDVEVWEEYPEFKVLEFMLDEEVISYVRGHDLTYDVPWWKFESMDANQQTNMAKFANLNDMMDAFKRALACSGLQIPYVHHQTNAGLRTVPRASISESTKGTPFISKVQKRNFVPKTSHNQRQYHFLSALPHSPRSAGHCHAQIDGFPEALYQKFNSTDEAYKAITSYVHPQNSIESSETIEENVSKKEGKANPRVFFDLDISSNPKGIWKNGKPLHYKGTIFHRVIPRCLFNGGNLTEGNRLGGESSYDDSFTDENLVNKHTGPEILSMANTDPGTNNSQFLICIIKTEWLDGNNIIFGQVIEGFDIIKAIEKVGSRSGLTSKPVTVANCGQLS